MGDSNEQISQLACYVMLSVCQANLIELFINQLSSLFQERSKYLRMVLENFQLIY
jgi:hypothetical protein